jgi:2-oxo-4-hydroxy-4-carboxy-5-ureidoimidazoline decarboxylase
MRLDDLNAMDAAGAERALLLCCGSTRWAGRMAASRPFTSAAALAEAADRAFETLERTDWLEAFAVHPKIGASGAGRSGGVEGWSADEQALVAQSADATRQRLADANRDYEARFGYIFIVCATGRSADEMLGLLEGRLGNDRESELRIAAGEQRKITALRLTKLLDAS